MRPDALQHHAVEAAQWRDAVQAALEDHWRFASLYAAGPGLRAVFTRGEAQLLVRCACPERRVASIVDVVPAAIWDEREAADLHGYAFDGHEPMRPLVDHVETAAWTAEDEGRDLFQVAVGPIHAGIIESGHFRFHVVGERILHLDPRLFYKHRGLEQAVEGEPLAAAIAYAQRACGADAVTNQVAYAQACEAALGLWPSPDLRRARTVLLELERVYNHLNDISAICAGVGFAPGTMLFASLKERAQHVNTTVTGHRFLFDSVAVARSDIALPDAVARQVLDGLSALREELRRGWHELRFAGSFQERLHGVGILTREQATILGAVGPAARAAGVTSDARSHSPRLEYPGFSPAAPEHPTGDVAARLQMRETELEASLALLSELLAEPLAAGEAIAERAAANVGVGVVESPRGQTTCAVELEGGRVVRMHLRTGSYANWPALALAVRDELLPDFPLINKSFELCYACVDR